MKVIVTSTGPGLDDELDPRFGRCQYFLLVDTETMQVLESTSNEGMMAAGGAGIQAGQFTANKGAEAVITGNVGPNAIQTLQAAGVGVYLAPPGTVRHAIEAFKQDALKGVNGATVGAHHGMGTTDGAQPSTFGSGPGMGTGRGMGLGRGMGRGMGRQFQIGESAEVTQLRSEIEGLKKDLDEMKEMLKKLTQS